MRHGLDFVDLQQSQIRLPPMGPEQGIVIGAKASWCTLPVNGAVEQQ